MAKSQILFILEQQKSSFQNKCYAVKGTEKCEKYKT